MMLFGIKLPTLLYPEEKRDASSQKHNQAGWKGTECCQSAYLCCDESVWEMISSLQKEGRWELELEPEMRSCRHFLAKTFANERKML
jgi:hypothetical protein